MRQGGENGWGTDRMTAIPLATAASSVGHGSAASAAAAARAAANAMLYSRAMTRVAQLELQSRYDTIELAERMLAEVCRSCAVSDEAVYWSGMALREALANAIKHGNKLSPDKRVFVQIEVNGGDVLRIAVEDQGEGFDPRQVANPLDPQNLLRESGRGVFYMRNFMDEVNFTTTSSGGTRIELTKKLSKGGRNEEPDS